MKIFGKGTRDKIVILRCAVPTKFQIYLTPPSGFFANKSYIFRQYLEEIFFYGSFYSFAPAKTCSDNFGHKLSKNWNFTFINF